jgi:hypothetical protein
LIPEGWPSTPKSPVSDGPDADRLKVSDLPFVEVSNVEVLGDDQSFRERRN